MFKEQLRNPFAKDDDFPFPAEFLHYEHQIKYSTSVPAPLTPRECHQSPDI